MSVPQVIQQVKSFFQVTFGKSVKVIGVKKVEEKGWIATVEMVEESEYMRSRALDDLVGSYEVELDQSMRVVGYQRNSLRERDQVNQKENDD